MNAFTSLCGKLSKQFLEEANTATGCACRKEGKKFMGTYLGCLPGRVGGSKQEAKEIFSRLKAGDVTVREAGQGLVFGVYLFGFFMVGEMIGRGSIIGYRVTSEKPYSDEHH